MHSERGHFARCATHGGHCDVCEFVATGAGLDTSRKRGIGEKKMGLQDMRPYSVLVQIDPL